MSYATADHRYSRRGLGRCADCGQTDPRLLVLMVTMCAWTGVAVISILHFGFRWRMDYATLAPQVVFLAALIGLAFTVGARHLARAIFRLRGSKP